MFTHIASTFGSTRTCFVETLQRCNMTYSDPVMQDGALAAALQDGNRAFGIVMQEAVQELGGRDIDRFDFLPEEIARERLEENDPLRRLDPYMPFEELATRNQIRVVNALDPYPGVWRNPPHVWWPTQAPWYGHRTLVPQHNFRWVIMVANMDFVYGDRDPSSVFTSPSVAGASKGYVLWVVARGHRDCDCTLSQHFAVALYHTSTMGTWPVHDEVTKFLEEVFFRSNTELIRSRSGEGVSYGFIRRFDHLSPFDGTPIRSAHRRDR